MTYEFSQYELYNLEFFLLFFKNKNFQEVKRYIIQLHDFLTYIIPSFFCNFRKVRFFWIFILKKY